MAGDVGRAIFPGAALVLHQDQGEEPSPTVKEARADLARLRSAAGQSVRTLRAEIRERVDWKAQFRSRPALYLTLAFVVGFLLGNRR